MLNWDGQPFHPSSLDFKNKGTPLAEGYKAVVFILRADLDFLSNHFGMNSPASNRPCCLCLADRQMSSATIWDSAEWAETNPLCHPLLKMKGAGLDLIYPDLMHLKHLGTDQVVLGGVLTYLIKHFMTGTVSDNLNYVWHLIQAWYKVERAEPEDHSLHV